MRIYNYIFMAYSVLSDSIVCNILNPV